MLMYARGPFEGLGLAFLSLEESLRAPLDSGFEFPFCLKKISLSFVSVILALVNGEIFSSNTSSNIS